MQPEEAIIARPRLYGLLEEAVQASLALVHAGAGFGKTLGASRFLEQSRYRAVWVNCTPLDNLAGHFWETLTKAFAAHRPGLGHIMRRLAFPDTLYTFNAFLAAFTAELYQDEQYVVFVFDDVHLITEPGIWEFLSNLVAARLENNCILLLTRAWPAALGSTMPAAHITADALRFTPEETAALFEARNISLAEDSLLHIHAYTAGWPIALSMAALVLRQKAQLRQGAALADAKPALFALFEQEIFSQYTSSEQDLLIKLSTLHSFPRGLVQAVSGGQRRELGELLGTNSFIDYDPDEKRLSFHPLYREFLQEKRVGMDPAALADTYCRAGDWCRENGLLYDALTYYGVGRRYAALWDTLLRFPANRHPKSEADFFLSQIESLPVDFREQHPMTEIMRAMLLANNLRFEEALALLVPVRQALEARPEKEAARLLGECYTVQGLIALSQEDPTFGAWFTKAAQLLPEGSARWGKHLHLLDLGPGLNLQSAKAGTLRKGLAAYEKGVPPMTRVLHGTGTGLDALAACEAAFLTGELKAAQEPAYHALHTARQAGQHDIAGNALFLLLRIYTIEGDYAQVKEMLRRIDAYAQLPEAYTLGIWDIARGWLFSEIDSARMPGWLINPTGSRTPPISIDRELLTCVRWMIATGREMEALALLEQHEHVSRSKKVVVSLLYTQLYRAIIYHKQGLQDNAMAHLRAAYRLAHGNNLVMPFIEYGSRTRSLLERALDTTAHGIPAAWLEEMHAKAGTCAKRHTYLAERWQLEHGGEHPRFALSKKEKELLSQLIQGLTREEIAGAMHWSLNTVKSMLTQVYGKLGAINRADAVRIALNAGLV